MRSTDILAIADGLRKFSTFAQERDPEAVNYSALAADGARSFLEEYAKHLADEEVEQDTVPASKVREMAERLRRLAIAQRAEENRKYHTGNQVWHRYAASQMAYDHAAEMLSTLLPEDDQ
jgi:hypothetical protein